MEQSPSWEAKKSSASQIPNILWNLKFITAFKRIRLILCNVPIPLLEDPYWY
jgi:hypothetical protein